MVQRTHQHVALDAAFAALADPTRRGVLEHLGRSEASVTELADRFAMTATGMKKHIEVLEAAGLVTTEKVGRVRRCRVGVDRLEDVAAWVERYQQLWDAALPRAGQCRRRTEAQGEHRWTGQEIASPRRRGP
jgi:DNA-binding transcriptional ArsR family regulator